MDEHKFVGEIHRLFEIHTRSVDDNEKFVSCDVLATHLLNDEIWGNAERLPVEFVNLIINEIPKLMKDVRTWGDGLGRERARLARKLNRARAMAIGCDQLPAL